MNTTDLLAVLTQFHQDKLTLRERHVVVAQAVSSYEFNNTYQYVIAREDMHLSWLESAIAELGGKPATVPAPVLPARGKKDSFLPLVAEDGREAQALVDRWRPRVADLGQARHQTLLQVILGETLEHRRFFDQMGAGQLDLLGRRSNGPGSPGTGDGVMGVRWVGDL